MRAIKHALTERFYTWEDAVKLAKEDPEVDLSGNGTPFTPMEYLEEEALDEMHEHEAAEEAQAQAEKQQRESGEANARTTTEVDPSTIPNSKANQDPARV